MDKLALLKSRHSVRSFTADPLPADIVRKIKSEITMTNTHQQGMRFQLITGDDKPFKGFARSYGMFENPLNYVAAVVDMATPNILERAGYFAEQLVIKAVSLGLGTCFVGGTFDEKMVDAQIRAGEKILFLVVLGYAAEKPRLMTRIMTKLVAGKDMSADDFFLPKDDLDQAVAVFPDLNVGLEAIACAPSAMNRRPVRVFMRNSIVSQFPGSSEWHGRPEICAEVDESNPKNLIDLGIAKYNFNFATDTVCVWGNTSPLSGGDW